MKCSAAVSAALERYAATIDKARADCAAACDAAGFGPDGYSARAETVAARHRALKAAEAVYTNAVRK